LWNESVSEQWVMIVLHEGKSLEKEGKRQVNILQSALSTIFFF